MNINRSFFEGIRLAVAALLSTLTLSACVVSDYYEDDYYRERPTVIVKHPRPSVEYVDVYETRPTVIYTRPQHYGQHRIDHYYVTPPRTSGQIILRPQRHPMSDQHLIIKPGRHQQQHVIIKSQNNYETHDVPPPRSTEVKHPKKIVIQRLDDAPPSTLAE